MTVYRRGLSAFRDDDLTDQLETLIVRCLSLSPATVAYSAPMARSRARRCRQGDGDHFRLSAHSE